MIKLEPNKMKSFTNLEEGLKIARKVRKKQVDIEGIVKSDIEFIEEGLKVKKDVHPVTVFGMTQILKKLRMPVSFYFNIAPTDMLIRDVNRMITELNSQTEFRVGLERGNVRCFVGDDKPYVSRVNVIKRIGNRKSKTLEFKGGVIDESIMDLRFIDTENSIDLGKKKPDQLFLGNRYVHSETGIHALSGMPLISRVSCFNWTIISPRNSMMPGFTINDKTATQKDFYLKVLEERIKTLVGTMDTFEPAFKRMKETHMGNYLKAKMMFNKVKRFLGKKDFCSNDRLWKADDEGNGGNFNYEMTCWEFFNEATNMAHGMQYKRYAPSQYKKYDVETLAGKMLIEFCNN